VSISHTTRSPRPGESHGVHYYFVSVEEFETLIEKGHFLEYAKDTMTFAWTRRTRCV